MFTAEELEEMRLADEEIEREFSDPVFAYNACDREMDKQLDRLSAVDDLDNREVNRKRKRRKRYNPEKNARCCARYYANNRESLIKKKVEYRNANKEWYSAYQAAYYAKHKDEINARNRAKRAATA